MCFFSAEQGWFTSAVLLGMLFLNVAHDAVGLLVCKGTHLLAHDQPVHQGFPQALLLQSCFLAPIQIKS